MNNKNSIYLGMATPQQNRHVFIFSLRIIKTWSSYQWPWKKFLALPTLPNISKGILIFLFYSKRFFENFLAGLRIFQNHFFFFFWSILSFQTNFIKIKIKLEGRDIVICLQSVCSSFFSKLSLSLLFLF